MGTPATLPANFTGWDQPKGGPPDTLPADFSGWDAAQPASGQKQAPLPPGQIPLTSYGAATLQGFSNIGKGVIDAGTGLYNTLRHPVDTAKSMIAAPGELAHQARQIPAAIHDINASADPAGTYLKTAGETAGEAGGQAVVGAAIPEAPGIVRDVAPPIIRGVARGTNAVLKKAPGVIGGAAGHAVAGWPGAAVGYALGKEILPVIKIPGENVGVKEPVFSKVPLGPAAPPAEVLQSHGLGGHIPPGASSEGLADIPVRAQPSPAPNNVRGPGEIPPTMIRPRAYYGGIPPEPIASRTGLALPPAPAERIAAPSVRFTTTPVAAPELARPVTENPVVGSFVRAMQKSGVPIADRPNLLLKGTGRVNRILGPEEELTGPLAKSVRQARRQKGGMEEP